jgi:hypothetical protein
MSDHGMDASRSRRAVDQEYQFAIVEPKSKNRCPTTNQIG